MVYYVGFGRAGDEFLERQRRTVIPATPAAAYVEVKCPVGSVPPLKLQHPPKIEVMPAVKSPAPAQAALTAPTAPAPQISRPYSPGHQPDITVAITEHEWNRNPQGRMILRTRVQIRNSNLSAVRSIRQHWLVCPGYARVNYGVLSLQTPGLSREVGPVRPRETLEGTVFTELPNAGATGPNYDIYFEDDLGQVVKATKPFLELFTVSETNVPALRYAAPVRAHDASRVAAMGLTHRKLQDLRDASLVSPLNGNPAACKAKAQHAFRATHSFIKEMRPGDVVPLLIAELEVTPEFRNYLAQKKLKQKYWSEWFAELIIDRFWSEISEG
jgi:hypothetical protein